MADAGAEAAISVTSWSQPRWPAVVNPFDLPIRANCILSRA